MELPTVKPAELKYSRDVPLDNVMRWYTNYLLSVWQVAWDRAKPADTDNKKGWVWFGSISCAAIHDRFPKVVFVVILWRILQTYFAAQEMELPLNILWQSSLLSMKIVLMYLPHRKRNCRWTTAKVPLLGWIIFSMIAFSQLRHN